MSRVTSLASQFRTEQETAFAGLLDELIAKIDQRFTDLDASVQKRFTDAARDISSLKNDRGGIEARYAERFKAIADRQQRTGEIRGFDDPQQARAFGQFIAAIYNRDGAELERLQKAGITPTRGDQGGYVLVETIVADIMREVDQAGIFLRNCPPKPVNSLSGGSPKGTSGLTVYHPDFGVAITVSTPGMGSNRFELVRYGVAVELDNWMLNSELAIALAEYVRTELGYALMLATDTEWFMGDGTSQYGKYTGLFKMTPTKSVTGDSGDDTFTEVIAKSSYYLAKMLGTLPQWAHSAGPKWYMHPVTFFSYLGVRDSAGMPIANVFLAQNGLPFYLMGYPVELVTMAPSETAVSTPFILLAALNRACRTYRHNRAVEFAMTDQLKWLEGISTVKADVPMDMKVRNSDGIVQLITAAG